MARPGEIERGREAFAAGRWGEAHARLGAAGHAAALCADDLERLATAAYLVGRDAEALAAWTRLHHACIDDGETARAARAGFWLALLLLLAGEQARASGWLARTQRLLGEQAGDCVEGGYAEALVGLKALYAADDAAAGAAFERAGACAGRFADADLMAIALVGRGQALVQRGQPAPGMVLLDEAMAGVSAGAVSPILAGILYCAVLGTCEQALDLRRAREWTLELNTWCARQPDLVPFRGQCLVHRAEVLQLQGEWPRALEQAREAGRRLAERAEPAAGRAFYQCGELHRLRGELEEAERMYELASRQGCEPQPGAALLRLAQGDARAAAAALRGVADLAPGRPGADAARAKLLAPLVEIQLAAGDLDAAGAAAEALAGFARRLRAPYLAAAAAQARGALLLARGEADAALAPLREAWTLWQDLQVPYEAARVRVLLGRACDALGDADSSRRHFDAASAVFERLGAATDRAALPRPGAAPAYGLSGRERAVLAL
ncbi:MAG: LuxR family transcriptional regulator, partial [Burkholderiales bacterium]|nr:LuxR family transcriptional regulator [Burkholderiales bacterium]